MAFNISLTVVFIGIKYIKALNILSLSIILKKSVKNILLPTPGFPVINNNLLLIFFLKNLIFEQINL